MLNNGSSRSQVATHTPAIGLLIGFCFFFSGLAGLVYEVVWARQLSFFLGITSYAHVAVITAYMAGLAAGSFYFGRRADRYHHPLQVYAWLEIGIGLYAAATPWLLPMLQQGYVSLANVGQIGSPGGHLTRVVIALSALLAPTFMMGGTLPLLVRGFITEFPGLGKATGRLYGLNTIGAMTGTLLAGYLLVPVIGLQVAIFTGVVINLAVAAIVLTLLRRWARPDRPSVPGNTASPEVPGFSAAPLARRQKVAVSTGFALAGFAALLTQLAWIRAFILVVGGSVYAFTITLTCFLAGIGLGSLLYSRYLATPGIGAPSVWFRNPLVQAAILSWLTGIFLLLGLPVIGELPGWFLAGYGAGLHNSFPLFQLYMFALGFGLMVLPTLFMGALFPLVTVIWTRGAGRAGRGIGTAYAINTTGTILGALLGGLFILPWLGIHDSIRMAAVAYLVSATAFYLSAGPGWRMVRKYSITLMAALTFMFVFLAIPPWNHNLMISGVFSNPDRFLSGMQKASLQEVADRNRLLFYQEGLDGTVAVRSHDEGRALVINGKVDASSASDLPTQILLGQLPLALDRDIRDVLLIGLGSGVTGGTLTASESLKNLTILEISQAVVEASALFAAENRSVLDDPRVNLVTADARNYMMVSKRRYDLVISEPSNPWLSGVSNLFTDEFLKLAKTRLKPGGVMTQWFHTYQMSGSDLKSMLKTFQQNFRHTAVWVPVFEDLVLIGSDEPFALSLWDSSPAEAAARASELSRIGLNGHRDLVRLYLFGDDLLAAYVEDADINSDDHPLIEFSAPRNLYADSTRQNMSDIFDYLQGRYVPAPVTGMVQQQHEYLDARFMDLRIGRPDEGFGEIDAQWLVSQLLLESAGHKVYGTIGSERVLDWREGDAHFQLRARWHESSAQADELKESLEPVKVGALLRLVLEWECAVPAGGFTRFELRAVVPNTRPGHEPDLAAEQAGRFECY